jgi:hypothetical protein
MPFENQKSQITGLVVDPRTRRGIQGVRVEAWDRDLLIHDHVGSAVTDAEGTFQIRFGGGFFRELVADRRPDLFFKLFRGDDLLHSTENAVLWNVKAGEIPVVIPLLLAGDGGGGGGGDGDTPPATAFVRGRVLGPAGAGIPGLRVAAADLDVGGEVPLGEAETGADGGYQITYDLAGVRARGKTEADVQVRVSHGDEALAASPVHWDAAREATIDIILAPEEVRRPSEYERLTAALGALLGGGDTAERLAAVREDDERQDITYLANKSGWDARMVAMAALAQRFGAEAGIHPAYFYALFRAGIPASQSALAGLGDDAVRAAWEHAAAQEVIPRALGDGIEAALERLRVHAAGGALDAPPSDGGSPLRDLLRGALGDDEERKARFAALQQAHGDDPDALWAAVAAELGPPAAERLRLDGRLSFLTLNSAALLERIHAAHAPAATADLVGAGLYRAEEWLPLLDGVEVPAGIPGEGEEKRASYAAVMAAQLRLSHPTAAIAHQVASGELPLAAEPRVRTEVHAFLSDPASGFELGVHPVEAFVRENGVSLSPPALEQLKTLQRVHQITPSDGAMRGLLEQGLHSARDVAQHDEQGFVERFAEALGGKEEAAQVYARAHQVHHAVLNLATSFLLRQGAPALHALSPAAASEPVEGGVMAAQAPAPAAPPQFPTLEGLFGEMDYCDCDHCRSVLGPAAYLVDLLNFLDPNAATQQQPAQGSPLAVLLDRRPDLWHLQLTCENTNTALPYIDLVNEVLEHYVVHSTLANFHGHDTTAEVTTADLLASPQFVETQAYDTLRQAVYPLAAPFHQPLQALRLHLEHADVPLHRAMELLRPDDALERPGGPGDPAYGWRDLLMERLGISRQEYRILTDSAISLSDLYGLAPATVAPPGVVAMFANAKALSRVLGVSYQELVELLRTEFVNPHSHLLPRLDALGLTLSEIHAVKLGTMSPAQLQARLPQGLDPTPYGGDVRQWLLSHHDRIMRLILLSDSTGTADPCAFDTLELRYAHPNFAANPLRPVELLRLHRLVRLWRRLGWSLRDTDRAVHALWPAGALPATGDSDAVARHKLDTGFKVLIPRLGHLCRVMDALELKPGKDLVPLLACFADLDTLHPDSLYRRLFLSPAVLKLDPAFADTGNGTFLDDPTATLDGHRDALRAAFGLTAGEWDLLVDHLQTGAQAPLPLDLPTVSAVFRHGFLARRLRLGVRELLGLIGLSGVDPFAGLAWAAPNPAAGWPRGTAEPPILPFIQLARRVRDSGLSVGKLLYLLRHDDPGGTASPAPDAVLDLARRLRGELATVERELGQGQGQAPTLESARASMARVYDDEAARTFFALLDGTVTFDTPYTHPSAELEPGLTAAAPQLSGASRLGYDPFQQRLTYRGRMTDAARTALHTAAAAILAPPPASPTPAKTFDEAVDELYTLSRAFLDSYPDLEPHLDSFEAPGQAPAQWLPLFLDSFLPALREKRKGEQLRQTVSAQLGADSTLAALLLETPAILHAADDPLEPAAADFLALEAGGLTAEYDVAGALQQVEVVPGIDFSAGGAASLPSPPAFTGGIGITATWSGWVEPPSNGVFTFRIDTDPGAVPTLKIGSATLALVGQGGAFRAAPLELRAGRPYPLELTLTGVKDRAALAWEAAGMARETVPAARLYPAAPVERFRATYLRLGKVLALAADLKLAAAEVELAAVHFGPAGWLNLFPAGAGAAPAATHALTAAVAALLRYARVKTERKVRGDALARALDAAAAAAPGGDGGAALAQLAGWVPADRDALLQRFGLVLSDLRQPHHFARVHGALALTRTLGAGAAALADGVTNEPDAARVAALQAALRARYDADAWRNVLQPINDVLRDRQRDALVAWVLHALRATHPHVDTPDRLYEFFLIDVQMEPCMRTSRIRQAIATVQLFVQRALLNLEPAVPSSAIVAGQWEWMRRYRLWEANRKVFLYPENWLEPEVRDDRSPFFKELESELLQGDVTDDAAAAALLGYLEKLDDVALLEVCGMYLEEGDARRQEDDVVHVVARTAGGRRTWYYRWLRTGSWSPWEKIGANIEDTPVLPVVWRGRTFVFWLGIQQQMPGDPGLPLKDPGRDPNAGLSGLKQSDLKTNTRVEVTAALYWSERVRGKWQPARSSDLARPLSLGLFPSLGSGAFDRRTVTLRSGTDAAGTLTLQVRSPTVNEWFRLYNTHALPVRRADEAPAPSAGGSVPRLAVTLPWWDRSFDTADGLTVRLTGLLALNTPPAPKVLGRAPLCSVVEPRHPVTDILTAPFFFQDRRHAFFVVPEQSTIRVDTWSRFGFQTAVRDAGAVHLGAAVTEVTDGRTRETLGGGGEFQFGTRVIGASGSLPATRADATER